ASCVSHPSHVLRTQTSIPQSTTICRDHDPGATVSLPRHRPPSTTAARPLVPHVAGETGRLSVDLTGCDDQRKSPTNATSSQTYSSVVYVLKCLIDPDIPVNDGFYRLIDIKSRPGSVVHAQHPAAVAAGWEIAMQLCDLLFRALAPALPDRVVAGTKGCVCNIAFGGVNPTSGEYFTYYETIAGGYGA